jgi:hypothetical protein
MTSLDSLKKDKNSRTTTSQDQVVDLEGKVKAELIVSDAFAALGIRMPPRKNAAL